MGNITINSNITGGGGGGTGDVGGASNLTTVGAIPYVSASGVLNQDPTQLFWDAANNRLGIGTAAPAYPLEITSGVHSYYFQPFASNGFVVNNNGFTFSMASSSSLASLVTNVAAMAFSSGNTERARFATTTGNFLIGTTTDSNFKLDVAASGSAGTMRVYGGSGVSDITSAVVRSGGGQANNSSFSVRNASDAGFVSIDPEANVAGIKFATSRVVFGDAAPLNHGTMSNASAVWNSAVNMVSLGSSYVLRWFTGVVFNGLNEAPTSNVDLSLSRASAGVLQVGDGGSNANGEVRANTFGNASGGATQGLQFAGSNTWLNGPVGAFSIGARTAAGDAIFVATTDTRNLLIGTTTDSGFKLDVAASGSAGTARFYGGAGVSDNTRVVVRAGAGQSTTNLTEWQNSGGTTVLLSIGPGGVISAQGNVLGITNTAVSTIQFGSTYGLGWSSTGTYGGAKDVAITRNAAGVIEVNNGTAGTYRDLILRRSQHNGVTVADLPAAAAGNAGSIQYVTDANATTIGSTVAGGGANKVMVWSDGAAWKIFAS